MHRLRARDQVAEWRGQQRQHLGARPVVALAALRIVPVRSDPIRFSWIPVDSTGANWHLAGCVLVAIVRSGRGHGGTHMA